MSYVKSIEFIHVRNNVDVGIELENGYSFTIVVGTPADLSAEMDQEKRNFIRPGSQMLIVKKLTKEIVTETIKA